MTVRCDGYGVISNRHNRHNRHRIPKNRKMNRDGTWRNLTKRLMKTEYIFKNRRKASKNIKKRNRGVMEGMCDGSHFPNSHRDTFLGRHNHKWKLCKENVK